MSYTSGVYTDRVFGHTDNQNKLILPMNSITEKFWYTDDDSKKDVYKRQTYQSTNEKYQLIPEEYNVCIKFRSEDWETIVPVLTPIFL